MIVAKVITNGKTKFVEVVKVGPVKFDPRPGWVLARECDKIIRRCEVFWFHPSDTTFVWIREFA
jgi:hypothetical protein